MTVEHVTTKLTSDCLRILGPFTQVDIGVTTDSDTIEVSHDPHFVTVAASTVNYEAPKPKRRRGFNWLNLLFGRQIPKIELTLAVTVPVGTRLELFGQTGIVNIGDTKGKVILNTGKGAECTVGDIQDLQAKLGALTKLKVGGATTISIKTGRDVKVVLDHSDRVLEHLDANLGDSSSLICQTPCTAPEVQFSPGATMSLAKLHGQHWAVRLPERARLFVSSGAVGKFDFVGEAHSHFNGNMLQVEDATLTLNGATIRHLGITQSLKGTLTDSRVELSRQGTVELDLELSATTIIGNAKVVTGRINLNNWSAAFFGQIDSAFADTCDGTSGIGTVLT
ncbi:MAG TPA: hypothetical protein VLG40_04230 [Candidatus Saccharimonas sp.]|nr:hypothetical protein [Candidatus Saccharimonas sp.]